jgi:hypothetical protein
MDASGEATLNLGSRDGVEIGMRFKVIADAIEVATLKVVKVDEQTSTGVGFEPFIDDVSLRRIRGVAGSAAMGAVIGELFFPVLGAAAGAAAGSILWGLRRDRGDKGPTLVPGMHVVQLIRGEGLPEIAS